MRAHHDHAALERIGSRDDGAVRLARTDAERNVEAATASVFGGPLQERVGAGLVSCLVRCIQNVNQRQRVAARARDGNGFFERRGDLIENGGDDALDRRTGAIFKRFGRR